VIRTAEEANKHIEVLESLLEKVLDANIAKGCKPEHPRIALIYEIYHVLEK
jgi:hypothetical protein